MMKKSRAKRETTLRSETISVRLDPKLRYLAKVAAQKQRRPISSFVEWAVEKSLAFVEIGPDGKTIADHANFLWDVDEPDRLTKLAFNFEELLNHEEQLVWKLIKDNRFFWLFGKDTSATRMKIPEAPGFLSAIGLPERGLPDSKKIREYWPLLLAVARGQEPPSALPKPDAPPSSAQTPSAPAPKAEKRQPRKD